VSAREYRTLLAASLISETIAAAGFFYLLNTSRGFLKYYSVVCMTLCLLIAADVIRRLISS
jgi:hypothetical protein